MGIIIVNHDEHGNSQVDNPTHQFALLLADRTLLSDTRTELLDALIPGYASALAGPEGVREAAWLRYTALLTLADSVSAVLLAAMVNDGTVTLADFTEDELNTMMPPDRITARPFTGTWDHQVPLIVLRSDYEPHSHLELPEGNVKFLDPTNESTFIDSLVAAGLGELHVREEVAT